MFIPKRAPELDRGMRSYMGIDQILHKIKQGPAPAAADAAIPLPAHFSFAWAGLTFDGTLDHAPRDAGTDAGHPVEPGHVIELTALLGRLPYSAEDPEARAAVRARLDRTYKLKDGVYEIAADGFVRFHAATAFGGTLNAEAILHALAISLLQLKPLLKAFDGLLQPA